MTVLARLPDGLREPTDLLGAVAPATNLTVAAASAFAAYQIGHPLVSSVAYLLEQAIPGRGATA